MKRLFVSKFETAKAKVNSSSTSRGLFLFVALPTFLAIIYYYVIAADMYVSETKFSVNVEGQDMSASALGMLIPSFSANSNTQQAILVREYINSRTMVDKLIKDADIKNIYDNPKADFLARIPKDLSIEDYIERYKGKVDVVLNETTGITTLKTKAFTASDAKKVTVAILDEAEEFVNKMARRVQEDSISFSKEQVEKSEQMVLDVTKQISKLRNDNRNFDPTSTATSVITITSSLEGELAKTKAEIANLKNFMKSNSPKIESLQAKAASLQQQIEEQSGRLAGEGGSKLADIAEQYELLTLQRQFSLKRLKVALTSYEAAQAEARKKTKYLLRIVEPEEPETATEPKKLIEVLTVFVACLIFYTLGGLIIAAIRDHIRP